MKKIEKRTEILIRYFCPAREWKSLSVMKMVVEDFVY